MKKFSFTIPTWAKLLGSGAAFAGMLLTSYYTSRASVVSNVDDWRNESTKEIGDVKGDVKVLQDARSSTDEVLKELENKVSRIPYIEGKMDAALGNLGVNSQKVEAMVSQHIIDETPTSNPATSTASTI